jgi:hypothetical protein
MPLYRFSLNEQNPSVEDEERWFSNDVAAMKAAAQKTAELVRTRHDEMPAALVFILRVKS